MPKAGRKRRTDPPARPGLVFFSDIDGTILDYYSYSFEPAQAAVRELKRRNVPLVLVSSKTSAEIRHIQKLLGLEAPFISEHGGAIFWPKSVIAECPRGATERNGCWVRELGTSYDKVRKHFIDYRLSAGVKLEGFGDWTPQQISREANMPLAAAMLAKKREYDEPFLFNPRLSDSEIDRHVSAICSNGWNILPGLRFFHLTGKADRSKAVRELVRWYQSVEPAKPHTIAFGDSPNDWAMMQECEIAVAVKRPDGKYHADLRAHKGIRLAGAPGPEGFNRMALRLMKQML
ncbi:MAG TPA: HAD-IIB family hydrolase [candidate division Zixibacteria bacterium]|jgi:mannosyl-3-phosphoglycerate phosphatase